MGTIRKKKERKAEEKDGPSVGGGVRYQKPRIILMDLPDDCHERLVNAGYRAEAGTFGTPYLVPKTDGYLPVICDCQAPGYYEQEVVIVDLKMKRPRQTPPGEKDTADGEKDWWAKASEGLIDPRPRGMTIFNDWSERILANGGCFVVFAEWRRHQETMLAKNVKHYGLERCEDINCDNWDFLRLFSCMSADQAFGEEIAVVPCDDTLRRFLSKHVASARYSTVLESRRPLSQNWTCLAVNKYEQCVAALIGPLENGGGTVLILPQLKDKAGALIDLVQTVLPSISPHLFPETEHLAWLKKEPYELEGVIAWKEEQERIRAKADGDIAAIEERIDRERQDKGFLHGILHKSGDALVKDVRAALELLGFTNIVDADELPENTDLKQEDLQIHDTSPVLLVEIKGMGGVPTEDDTQQVVKYISRKMRSLRRTDIQGVVIVNHQKNLPPLTRDNANVFTPAQVADAQNHSYVVLTTWDLFRLAAAKLKWGWPSGAVKPLFYRAGRPDIMPSSYERIGMVTKVWPDVSAVGISVEQGLLSVGDRVAYITDDGFHEEDVTSLEIDSAPVPQAGAGETAGSKTCYTKDVLRENMPVFRVMPS